MFTVYNINSPANSLTEAAHPVIAAVEAMRLLQVYRMNAYLAFCSVFFFFPPSNAPTHVLLSFSTFLSIFPQLYSCLFLLSA